MNPERTADQIRDRLSGLSELYNRLLLLVGPTGSGKTETLRNFSAKEGCSIINIGIELGRRLLDLTERQRVIELPNLLETMVAEVRSDVVILDNTEVLFDPGLNQDPLRLLKALSRNRTIIASWLGSLENQYLTYATPEHREFRRYPVGDVPVLVLPTTGGESVGN